MYLYVAVDAVVVTYATVWFYTDLFWNCWIKFVYHSANGMALILTQSTSGMFYYSCSVHTRHNSLSMGFYSYIGDELRITWSLTYLRIIRSKTTRLAPVVLRNTTNRCGAIPEWRRTDL